MNKNIITFSVEYKIKETNVKIYCSDLMLSDIKTMAKTKWKGKL